MDVKWHWLGVLLGWGWGIPSAAAEPPQGLDMGATMGLDSQIVEQSSVLRRWLVSPPNLLDEIRTLTARPTRIQVGYVARDQWFLGVDDLYLGSQVSLSGEYDHWHLATTELQQFSAALRYFVVQPGSRLNLAPQAGYRTITATGIDPIQGFEIGAMAVVILAPQTADMSLDYRWLPGSREATTLSLTTAYALSRDFRLATRYRWQNNAFVKDFQVGLMLEWTP